MLFSDMGYDRKQSDIRYREANREKIRKSQSAYANSEKGMSSDKRKKERNKAKASERQKRYTEALKDKCYNAYGGYVCNCCGEKEKQFLTLDHINNDGYKHRKTNKSSIYFWIVKNGFPPIFQVLCMNCNWGRHRNGGVCPHKSISI